MTELEQVLAAFEIHPVLVDVGASGAPPKLWKPFAARAIYVGFDPDAREFSNAAGQGFYRAHIVSQAVTAETDRDHLDLFLTRSPYCSSTLRPDTASLANYLFADLFQVEQQVSVPAISLEAAVRQLALPGIDWLKLDTQGTDLRLFNSLTGETRNRILALDLEPGLIDAYQGEDLFVESHCSISAQGFWLSRLEVKGAVRMKRESLRRLPDVSARRTEHALRTSPAWVEARYLRSIESLTALQAGRREWALLWAFALADDQWGFGLDVALAFEARFGADAVSERMLTATIDQIRRAPITATVWFKSLLPSNLKRWLRRLAGR